MTDKFNLSRRELLVSLPALVLAPRFYAQSSKPQIAVKGINHVTLQVSDLKRSVDFYQGLFGTPVISRQGTTELNLQIGNGPQFLGLASARSSPNINHICLAVDNFNIDRVKAILRRSTRRETRASDLHRPRPNCVHARAARVIIRLCICASKPSLKTTAAGLRRFRSFPA